VNQSNSVPLFHGIIGNKIMFKVQMHSILGQHYSDQFKVVNLFGDIAGSSLPVQCINDSLKVIVSHRTRNNILVLGDFLVARILMKNVLLYWKKTQLQNRLWTRRLFHKILFLI
ncbi:hypothetical protein HN873_001639, partial [Arachis hypogaea]